MARGTVYWFTGMAGAGKSAIARCFYRTLSKNRSAVFLDGDDLRKIFGGDLGYGRSDRKKSAMRNARLCKFLSDAGIDVVCATISLFHECHRWNRRNIRFYKEIYVHAPMDVLAARNPKKIYSRASSGRLKNVWGVDLRPEIPRKPDMVIHNDGRHSPASLEKSARRKLLGGSR